jgi:hypothetical protein
LTDENLREDLYLGSIYAGLELNVCGAAFPHTVGYVLTENFGIPHGKACTAFMPYLLEKAKKYKNERYCELLEILGDSEESVINIINSLTNVKNLPARGIFSAFVGIAVFIMQSAARAQDAAAGIHESASLTGAFFFCFSRSNLRSYITASFGAI